MNSDVALIPNSLFYSGSLQSDAAIANAKLELPRAGGHALQTWIGQALRPDRSVIFVDTTNAGKGAQEGRPSGAVENPFEVQLCLELVSALTQAGLATKDILVLSPYRRQLATLQAALGSFRGIDILTIDKSQGRSVRCVIVSMVRCNSERRVGELLCDWRRLNVALSRAKHKLVMLGSAATLAGPPVTSPGSEAALAPGGVWPGEDVDGRTKLYELTQLCRSRDWVVPVAGVN